MKGFVLTISTAEVQKALRKNLQARPKDLVMCLRFTKLLIDKVGRARLAKSINVEGYFTILADVIDAMLDDKQPDCVEYMQSVRRLNNTSNWVAGLRRDANESRHVSGNHRLSAETVFCGPLGSLSDDLKAKFLRGEMVTYEDVLRVKPEMFFALA